MVNAPDHLEIEVKFFVADPQAMLHRLIALGGTARPEVFETNIRFEDRDHSLKANESLLRLRQDGACRLTYKCRPGRDDPECKVFRELEVEISDFSTMVGILQSLGFRSVQTYEKRRRTFLWRDTELCLDTMPFGTFLEIEGPKISIKAAAGHLDLSWENRIVYNYLAIFEALRDTFKLPFNDVTFANFENYPVDISTLLHQLQAGR